MSQKAIVFDDDGTLVLVLVDSVDLHTRAWQEAFKEVGKQIGYGDLRAQIGKGADLLIRQEEISKKHYSSQVRPFSSVPELLKWHRTFSAPSDGDFIRTVGHLTSNMSRLLNPPVPSTWATIGLAMSLVSTENRQFVISDVNMNCALSPNVSTFALLFFRGSQSPRNSSACQ